MCVLEQRLERFFLVTEKNFFVIKVIIYKIRRHVYPVPYSEREYNHPHDLDWAYSLIRSKHPTWTWYLLLDAVLFSSINWRQLTGFLYAFHYCNLIPIFQVSRSFWCHKSGCTESIKCDSRRCNFILNSLEKYILFTNLALSSSRILRPNFSNFSLDFLFGFIFIWILYVFHIFHKKSVWWWNVSLNTEIHIVSHTYR